MLGDGGQQRRLVVEVPIGRIGRYADFPGLAAQTELIEPVLLDEAHGHVHQCIAEISMVVRIDRHD